jgi:hypothetical protein
MNRVILALTCALALCGCGSANHSTTAKHYNLSAEACPNIAGELQTVNRHVVFGYGPRLAAIELARGARADAQIVQRTAHQLGASSVTQALGHTRAGFENVAHSVNVHVGTLPPRKLYREYGTMVARTIRVCTAR